MNPNSSFTNKPMIALAITFFLIATGIFIYAVIRLFGGQMEQASILTLVGLALMMGGTFFLSRSQNK